MKIPGFTPHQNQHRANLLVPAEVAQACADEAKRRGVRLSVVLRERVTRGGESSGPAGLPVLDATTADGRRVVVYVSRPDAAKEKP